MAQETVKKWTPSQRQAIDTRGSVLVSAAAGSGKTAVLAERCAQLVCDTSHPCDIDQLLVVTFTESAAAEMKSRIRRALQEQIARLPTDQRLARQLALVEHAHVNTVHGFCRRLLVQNFHLIGLDPAFEVLDGDEAVLLRLEVADELFQRRYETDESGEFQSLIDCYGDGKEERLIDRVIWAHALLGSLENPGAWITRVRGEIAKSAAKPLQSSRLGRQLLEQVHKHLDALTRQCVDARTAIAAMDKKFTGYAAQLSELHSTLIHWQQVLKDEGLDMLVSEFRDFRASPMPPAPRVANLPGKDLAKSRLDQVKDAMHKKGPLTHLLGFTATQWQQGMAQTAPHGKMFLSLVEDFAAAYSEAKKSVRALDFSDLEHFALRVLRDNPAVTESLRHQFRHVLVDEYQDINEIQDAILTQVSRQGAAANLFCVGDVKQSIFRFRLADPQRFLDRQKSEPNKVIHLQDNFRSRGPLLDSVNAIFERLMTREAAEIEYDKSHRLKAGREFPPAGNLPILAAAPIQLHLLPKDKDLEPAEDEPGDDDLEPELDRSDYEAILLARQIERMMGHDGSPRMNVSRTDATGNTVLSPIEYDDIVILLRSMRHKADTFADVLTGYKIPVHNEGGGGFFEAVEIRDMLCLLEILDNQQQDIPLAAVLRSPLAAITNADDFLARIRLRYAAEPEAIPFHQAVRRYAKEENDDVARRLQAFLIQLSDWRDQANKRPVAELLWSIYETSGYLAYCSGLPAGQQRVANLIYLHERAGQFGTFLRQGLHRFLRFLQNLREEKDLGRPSTAAGSEQAVRIMSIHRSKGLEFPVVLLPDLGKAHNLSDTKSAILLDRTDGLGVDVVDESRMIRYPSLSAVLVRDSLHRQTLAEELRLLYVAMTRAKEHLVLVGTCGDKKIDRWTSQWENFSGPLPPDEFLGGSRALDWLGPVAAMTAAAQPSALQIVRHDAADVRAWSSPHFGQQPFSGRQQQMADFEKLSPSPAPTPASEQIQRRFQAVYPHKNFTLQAASASVTTLAKAPNEKSSAGESQPNEAIERKLDLPAFFIESADPKATDIGTATHLVLQHWDFAGASIDSQINALITRKIISPNQAKMVNRSAISWFLDSEVGQLLKTHHDRVMREIPFAVSTNSDGLPPDGAGDPLDRIMVRGRIDLLIPLKDGLAIVDYKTDKIPASAVPQRAQSYAGQMRFYRQAIEKVAGQKISAIYLVFLTPGMHVDINSAAATA